MASAAEYALLLVSPSPSPWAAPPRSAVALKFPTYGGTDDPLPWLIQCEQYFSVYCTPKNKVSYTSFHLLDSARLWYYRLELNNCPPSWHNGRPPSWHHFVNLIHTRFVPPLMNNPLSDLSFPQGNGRCQAQEASKGGPDYSCAPSVGTTSPALTNMQVVGGLADAGASASVPVGFASIFVQSNVPHANLGRG